MKSFFQSGEYGCIYAENFNYDSKTHKGIIYLEGVNPNFYLRKQFLYFLFKPLLKLISKELLIQHVPSTTLFFDLLSKNYTRILITPDYYNSITDFKESDDLIMSGFTKSEKATIILYLKNYESFEKYEKTLNKAVLQKIKKNESRLFFKKISNEEELKLAYDVYLQTSKRNKIRIVNSFEIFKNLLNHDVIAFYVITDNKDRHLSFQGTITYNNMITLFGVSTSDYAMENRMDSNDFLQYCIIKNAFANKINLVDWVGYELKTKDPKLLAINHFKEKWRGTIVRYNEYSKCKENLVIRWLRKLFLDKSADQISEEIKQLTLNQRIAADMSIKYKKLLLNQYNYLEKNFSLQKNLSFDELKTLADAAQQKDLSPERFILAIEKYIKTHDIMQAISSAAPKKDVTPIIESIIEQQKDLIGEQGVYAKGKVMAMIKQELGADFDGKTASHFFDKKLKKMRENEHL